MKIDLQSIDKTQFMVHPYIVNGEELYLVQPQHMGANWTLTNKIFRSSVWNALGELVSAGFPKFVNWGELPEVFPVPDSLKGAVIPEKIDGSLLIVSKYKGQFILRTRGTIDASKLENGFELETFMEKVLKPALAFPHGWDVDTWDWSLLFEWTSPFNKIVLNYGDEPQWFFIGAVEHDDYSLWTQEALDNVAAEYGWKRPQVYKFDTTEDVLKNVNLWEGKEGVVVYTNKGQTLHKVKSDWYLVRHHMKAELNSFEKVIDFWLKEGKPEYLALRNAIIKFDYELWAQPTTGFASQICDAYKEVKKIVEGMRKFLNENVLPLGDPKDKKIRGKMAAIVFGAYGKTNRATFIFSLLDHDELDDKDIKKLMFQVMKK